MLPNHLRPHIGEKRPFRCSLYSIMRQAFATGGPLHQEVVLAKLLENIAKGTFKPFFSRDEANLLVREEVLNVYAAGKYSDWRNLAAIPDWNDLINNKFGITVNNLLAAKVTPKLPLDLDIVLAFQIGHRQLKLIEDWIYYNPNVQKAIRAQISTFNSQQG